MLNIIFDRFAVDPQKFVIDPRIFFKTHKKPEWFETDFAKTVIKDIDKCEVLFEEALKDRLGHGISTLQLSTGTKSLLNIYFFRDQYIWYGSSMGQNCAKYLIDIAKESDLVAVYEHWMNFPEGSEKWILLNGKPISSLKEYKYAYCDWEVTYYA